MTVTNSSTKKKATKRNPVVQVVLTPTAYKQFAKRCKEEKRSESSMGAILLAQALNTSSSNDTAV